jgi:hypothetical protein
MNKKVSRSDNAETSFVPAASNREYFADYADKYEEEGLERINAGIAHASEIDQLGLPCLLGVIRASILWCSDTKPEIIESMQYAAPRLTRSFCIQLLDILTGDDPNRHMVQVARHGVYNVIEMT